MQVVWFKRDLRIHDHDALKMAASQGRVLPIYVLEPELWAQPDMSARHYAFLCDCLHDLDVDLKRIGLRLIIRIGSATEVFENLRQKYSIDALWSHQETWNAWTYKRDLMVQSWCQSHGIAWHEPPQNGVVRRLKNRDGWAASWATYMSRPLTMAPQLNAPLGDIASDTLPSAADLGLAKDGGTMIQAGGRKRATKVLDSFLNLRGETYTRDMSSPLTGTDSCSRLSPHLAFGTLSIREVTHAAEARARTLADLPPMMRGKWPSAMKSFSARLRWHCHFIQKLEDAPDIEFKNLHPAYDGLRPIDATSDRLDAWREGMTGYPMIDACMRSLRATGWLNFRMRAMVMSFASYHLWLDWRATSQHLARMFTDYEPGIHYPQVQMQSGTTGINSIRIYNPIKQSIEQDPDGIFIRRWIPELRDMDPLFLHTPWKMPSALNTYPTPIVDEAIARRSAADLMFGLRKNNPDHKATAQSIVKKHASRKQTRSKRIAKTTPKDPAQQEFPF
jgi:deoxyribodipyrimidine photo-lyase